ncbi:MAG: hypothetical protein WAW37_18215 [Syntrophobacteraceae bacterium]
MSRLSLLVLAVVFSIAVSVGPAKAAGDLTAQDPVEIKVQLGDEKDTLRFFPESIDLETGKLYRLILFNPSPQKHYFSSEGLAQAVFTRKVQVNGPDGKPTAEVKGQIREIEVYPGGTSEWWFVPVKTGKFKDLTCTIPGHTQKGMVGGITIK